jgi:hypothetical protein
MKERKRARGLFYSLSSSRMLLKRDVKNSTSYVEVKNISFIGPRIIGKTIPSSSERIISLIE